MNLTLQRTAESLDGPTFGVITNDADVSVMVPATLELPWKANAHNISRIPAGVYPAFRFLSPHIGYELFQLANVPDRVGVDIHIGNTMKDTAGCILVGEALEGDAITESREAFRLFMGMMTGLDRFTLTVVDVAAN